MAEEAERPRVPQQQALRQKFQTEAQYRAYFSDLARRPRSQINRRQQVRQLAVALDSLTPAQRDLVLALIRAGQEAQDRELAGIDAE